MNELINTELELRKAQGSIGAKLIVYTVLAVIIIGALPLISTFFDENAKLTTTIMSESYIQLIVILSIPLIIGLTAGIILIKSSVKNFANSYFKELEWTWRLEEEKEQNISTDNEKH